MRDIFFLLRIKRITKSPRSKSVNILLNQLLRNVDLYSPFFYNVCSSRPSFWFLSFFVRTVISHFWREKAKNIGPNKIPKSKDPIDLLLIVGRLN